MALLAYVFFLTKIGQEMTQLALRARIQTQLTRKRSHPSHYNVLDFPFPLSFGAMPPVVAFAVGEC